MVLQNSSENEGNKLANMHYGRIRHGDKCATPFKSIMSFDVICVVCIFASQFCHDLGEKDDVFLQKPRIWQM